MGMRKLTEKQEKFAQAVGIEGVSQSEAYRRAYSAEKMQEKDIWVQAHKVARLPHVAQRIATLKADRVVKVTDATVFDIKKLLETYIAIAMVDSNELIAQRVGACRHCWGIGGGYQWKEHEYIAKLAEWERLQGDKRNAGKPMPDPSGGFGYRFTAAANPECLECEGEGVTRIVPKDTTTLSPGAKLLYRGVQQTKECVKVLFADKDKALDQIGRIIGAYDDKLRIDLEAKVADYKLTTTDPAEAAAAYNRMITGT